MLEVVKGQEAEVDDDKGSDRDVLKCTQLLPTVDDLVLEVPCE